MLIARSGCAAFVAVAVTSCLGPDGGELGDASISRSDGVARKGAPADRPGGTGACDKHLASLFGGDGAVAAGSGFEPQGFQGNHQFSNGADRSIPGGTLPNQWGHLFGYAMHLYAAPVGRGRTAVHVPAGFSKYAAPSGGDAVALFYYSSLGRAKDVTLAVYHVLDFAVLAQVRNAAGSIRVGTIGGPGGESVDYVHSHFEVHRGWGLPKLADRNATRLFFYDVFCPVSAGGANPVPAGSPPASWKCDPSYYDETGHGAAEVWCDCDCGAPDPDCKKGAVVDGCASGATCTSAGLCSF